MTLAGDLELQFCSDYALTFLGMLSGPGQLKLFPGAPATLTLAGTVANTYSGGTILYGGNLLLSKPAGVNAVTGPLRLCDCSWTTKFQTLLLSKLQMMARSI